MRKRPSCCRSTATRIDPSSAVPIVTCFCSVVAIGVSLLLFGVSSFSFHTVARRVPHGYSSIDRRPRTSNSRNPGRSMFSHSPLDGAESAQPLPLSKADLARMNEMKTRGKVIPVVLLDAMLPGQRIYFSSADPKFEKLLQYVIRTERDHKNWQRQSPYGSPSSGSNNFYSPDGGERSKSPVAEIGILGFNPITGEPLTVGTTARIPTHQITYGISRNQEKVIGTSFKGHDTFVVVGDPWMDPTQSFYLAHVEVLQYRTELLATQQQEIDAEKLFCNIPTMIDEWMDILFEKSITTPAAMQQQLKELGPMPPTKKERAIWVAALLNPIQQPQHQQQQSGQPGWRQRVCEEIRPAMLICRNDYDRLILASTALQSSMDLLRKSAQS